MPIQASASPADVWKTLTDWSANPLKPFLHVNKSGSIEPIEKLTRFARAWEIWKSFWGYSTLEKVAKQIATFAQINPPQTEDQKKVLDEIIRRLTTFNTRPRRKHLIKISTTVIETLTTIKQKEKPQIPPPTSQRSEKPPAPPTFHRCPSLLYGYLQHWRGWRKSP